MKKVAILNVGGKLETLKGEETVLAVIPALKICDNEKQAAIFIEGYNMGKFGNQ